MTHLIGSTLGNRYEIIEIIGTGGMAVVYKGKDTVLNRLVAIKVLKHEFNSDEDFVKKFQKESQAAASLSHPNIVNVFDVGYSDNVHYIVMELVSGNTLKDFINNMMGFMKEEAIINIGLQIASALSQAHQNDIVHRDIKSQNILINEQGSVKVADFGIARAATSTTLVNTKEVMGSVHYTSPEQARGGFVDARSDIYSLGILLFELATKTLPFEGDSPVTIALKHIKDEMPNPKRFNPELSDGLASIIHKCTEKSPNERYQTIVELIEDLKRLRTDKHFIVENQAFLGQETTIIPKLTEDEIMAHQTQKRDKVNEMGTREGVSKQTVNKELKTSNKNKLNMTLAILLAFVLAAVIFGAIILTRPNGTLSIATVEVPSVEGMSSDEAVRTLSDLGLVADITEQRMHNDIEAGYIISQSIEEGQKVKEGYTIKLVVSSGGVESIIPNVLQQMESEAIIMIENSGFEVGEITYEDNDLPEGMVITQSPKGGKKMDQGTKVDLVISQAGESDMVLVPSLVTKSIKEAEETLFLIGLKLGDVTYESSEEVTEGQVISNSKVGKEVEKGSFVDIVVSKGNEPTTESTQASGEEVTSEQQLTVTIDTTLFTQDTETIRIEMVQNGVRTTVYEKVHSKSEGNEVIIQSKIKGSGTAKILVYYGEIVRLEHDVQF